MTGPPRVLVVDDEPQIVRGLKIILRNAGYIVEAAETVEALAALASRPPDAVVLDLVLPARGGHGRLPRGTALEQEPDRRSSRPSANSSRKEKVRALDAGADDCS